MTNERTPTFRFEYESIGGPGELIAKVGRTGVATPLTGFMTRTLHLLLLAQDSDPAVPREVHGLRTNGELARAYAKHAGFDTPLERRTITKYVRRIELKLAERWAATFPGREPPQLFDRQGNRGLRLAISIPPSRRRRRRFRERDES